MQDAEGQHSGKGDPNKNEQSALCTVLLNLWSSGHVSGVAIQKIAFAAMLDGANHSELVKLAKAGDFGQCSGNVARDINRAFLSDINLALQVDVEVPCLDPKTSKETKAPASILLPHLMFWSLMTFYYTEATVMFALDGIEQFWQQAISNNDPELVSHPMLSVARFASQFVPLFIHGDGVEYQDRDSLLTYSWGALLSSGSSQDSSLLLALWPKSCTIKGARNFVGGTWHHILLWLAWSFDCLFNGMHPLKDPFGQTFEKGSLLEKLAGTPVCHWTSLCFMGH